MTKYQIDLVTQCSCVLHICDSNRLIIKVIFLPSTGATSEDDVVDAAFALSPPYWKNKEQPPGCCCLVCCRTSNTQNHRCDEKQDDHTGNQEQLQEQRPKTNGAQISEGNRA